MDSHRNLRSTWNRFATTWVVALLVACGGAALAQELEPRAYRALPKGLEFAILTYSYSSGNVLVDPTVPVEDLEANVQTFSLAYLGSFGISGRSASISFNVPYVHLSASGTVQGVRRQGSQTDWADARVRLSVNLLGGPAMDMPTYAKFKQGRTLGVGLTVSAPTGQYDSSAPISFGANRWGFKPELGYSSVQGRWILDATLGVWLFTENTDPFGASTRSQDPIGSLQAHVSYNFDGGVWLALDGNYFYGGRTSDDGEPRADLQSNSRLGLTLSLPLAKRHSLRFAIQSGAYTRAGADFDVGSIAYQVRWGKP